MTFGSSPLAHSAASQDNSVSMTRCAAINSRTPSSELLVMAHNSGPEKMGDRFKTSVPPPRRDWALLIYLSASSGLSAADRGFSPI